MSTQYRGIPGNVVIPGLLIIASSTNTNPAQVAFTGPHNLLAGDVVDISGHQVNTVINGQRPVSIVNATTVSVPVAGIAVGGATGEAVPLTLGSSYAIPSDGDLVSGDSVDVALEALGDRDAFMATNIGGLKLVSSSFSMLADSGALPFSAYATVTTAHASGWVHFFTLATTIPVQANDTLQLMLATNALTTGGSSSDYALISLGAANYVPGGSPTQTKIAGSGQLVLNGTISPASIIAPMSLTTLYTVSTTGYVDITVGCQVSATGSVTVDLLSDANFQYYLWRPTQLNQ